jgi:hypothetical protein
MKYYLKKIFQKIPFIKEHKIVSRYTIPISRRQLRTFLYLSYLYPYIKNIEGSIVECGVGKGRTLLYLVFLSEQEGKNRILYGFDSFQGFPEPGKEDDSSRKPKRGDWSDTSISEIIGKLGLAGFSKEWLDTRLHLIQGFFGDTVHTYNGGPIAFLHVDADLYSSYRIVLNTFYDLVVPGGVVLFDEYNEDAWPGAKKAVDEFINTYHEELLREPVSGKYYFIKR